ncbi:PaaI family thioesterase [Amaricoccus tamworthensis]|uniref:PaaI family thioesterase n=1 Tax=Amaricoccus tamworthensis TaxID=57002 RepID=UPI003C7EBF1B
MPFKRPEPVQVVKQRRDAALKQMVAQVPYIQHLGVVFERHGDELTALLQYDEKLVGNPVLQALHGGAIGAFLEITAIMELSWQQVWNLMEGGGPEAEAIEAGRFPPLPKTIDFTVDYLRGGLPRDAYARARVNRSGRRYASVHVEAWQDNRARLFAQGTGHFLMPQGGKTAG